MPAIKERIATLLFKHLENNLAAAETDELNNWIIASGDNKQLFYELTSQAFIRKNIIEMERIEKDIWESILEKAPELKKKQFNVS